MSNITDGCIELSRDESTGIATICLNNPRKRNAINRDMIRQLTDIMSKLENWKTGKAVIIFGKNGFFSSGIDLSFLSQIIDSPEDGHLYSSLMVSNLSRLSALPLLSVAVIDGMALGGGAEIATACDLRVMTRSAKIGFVQIRIGVSTAWSGGCRLVHICGATKALDLLLSGRVLSATQALDLGLVNHLVDDFSQLINTAIEWLNPIITNDQANVTSLKVCINNKQGSF